MALNGANNFKTTNLRVSGVAGGGFTSDGRRASRLARYPSPPAAAPDRDGAAPPQACVQAASPVCHSTGAWWRALVERKKVEEHPQDDWAGDLRRGARSGYDGAGNRPPECGRPELGCR